LREQVDVPKYGSSTRKILAFASNLSQKESQQKPLTYWITSLARMTIELLSIIQILNFKTL